jgi:hypothetical protein
MKRLLLTLAAGAFGSLMLLPIANAQDMGNDAQAIQHDDSAMQHDRDERREDVEQGRYGAAAREQAEIDQRRADKQSREQDLRNDMSNRYDGDEFAHRYHHSEDDDD